MHKHTTRSLCRRALRSEQLCARTAARLAPSPTPASRYPTPNMSPKFLLRSRVDAEKRYSQKRWGDDAGYETRKTSLERQGLLAWIRLEWDGELLVANVFPVDGEVDLALWRPWQLHVSVAFRGEVSEAEVARLKRLVDRRLFRIRFHNFGSGGSGDIAVDDPLYRALRPVHARGWYGRRPLHMSF